MVAIDVRRHFQDLTLKLSHKHQTLSAQLRHLFSKYLDKGLHGSCSMNRDGDIDGFWQD